MNDLNLGEKNDNRKHGSHEKAAIIRAILSLGDLSGKLDLWLPFPQNSCCFLFGKDKLPIPVGALVYLWDHCPLFTGKCPKCGGKTYSYAFGGLLSIGDIRGCCVSCGESVSNPVGGLGRLSKIFTPILEDTPYYINGMVFGGTYEGKRRPLLRALKKLGIKDLPDDEWASGSEPSAASFSIKSVDGYKVVPPIPLDENIISL